MALGALLTTRNKGAIGTVSQIAWNLLAPNDALIGTPYLRPKFTKDLPGGLAAAEALFTHFEQLSGLQRQLVPDRQNTWRIQGSDGTNVVLRHSSKMTGEPAVDFNVPGRQMVRYKFK
jgi:hypothetical protein